MTTLLTVGHGTSSREELAALLTTAGVQRLVDVRSYPGSRRHPHVARSELAQWLGEEGIAYRWEKDLGGFRRPSSPRVHPGLRHEGFRGYAEWMEGEPFRAALQRLLEEAAAETTAVMCSESLWWRCHRRLLADAATLLAGAEVRHLGHDGSVSPHRLTPEARVEDGRVAYPDPTPSLPL